MWFVYLVRVQKSNALYCGITNNLESRIKAHRNGKGAKYLRGKGEITLEWFMAADDRSHASKLEVMVKRLSKREKEQLVRKAPQMFCPVEE